MCLGEGADLHMAQLMTPPLTISCSSKSRLVLLFRCQLIQVVLNKIQGGHSRKRVVYVCVCVCVNEYHTIFKHYTQLYVNRFTALWIFPGLPR